jgi:hypothetical protein
MILPCGCQWERTPEDRQGPIFFNEHNDTVCCHMCGHIYDPRPWDNRTGRYQEDPDEQTHVSQPASPTSAEPAGFPAAPR